MAQQDASDFAANTMLNALGTVYVGLSSTPPNDADGSNITEPAAGSDYVRATVAFGTAASRKRLTTAISNFVSGGGNATVTRTNFGYATFWTSATIGSAPSTTFLCSTQLSQALAWTVGLPVTMAIGEVSLEFEAPS